MINHLISLYNFIVAIFYVVFGTLASALMSFIFVLLICWIYEIPIFTKCIESIEIDQNTIRYMSKEEIDDYKAQIRHYNRRFEERTNPQEATFYDPSCGLVLLFMCTAFGTGIGLCYCFMMCIKN